MNTKISIFSSTISQHLLLSHNQERTASKQELVLANIRLVMVNARKYTSDPDEYEDFVSEGLIGLMTAAEKYTWRAGCSFSTYGISKERVRQLRNTASYKTEIIILSSKKKFTAITLTVR